MKMSVKVKSENIKKYKLVPPDGGWAYVICFACIVILLPTGGFRPSFSLMYHDLMEEIGMGSTKVGFVAGCNVMAFSLTGYLAGPLLKVLSLRQLALIAIILYNLGAFCSAFTNSVATFIICQSLLQNAGFGILYNLVFTVLKDYFSKKRLLAVSIVQTFNGIASVCVPFIIKGAIDSYGHRGMLIILNAVSLHAFIGVSLLQPVKWHMIKEEVLEEYNEETKFTSNKNETNNVKANSSSITDKNKSATDKSGQSTFKVFMKELVDVKILKEFGFSLTCIALSTAFVADFLYSLMITKAFFAKGMSREYVASSMSLIATGDLAMRIVFTFFSERLKKMGSKRLFAGGALLAFVARSGMLLSDNETSILVFLTITGIARSFGNTLIPVVIADTVTPEDYSASLGITMLIIGVLNLSLGPIVGAIRDYTNSYDVVLYSISLLFLAVAGLLVVDMRCKKSKHKKE